MSDDRLERLEASMRRVIKEVVLQGERLAKLAAGAKRLDKLGELDRRVTAFAGDVEAARRERTLRDFDFKERRQVLQDHEARLLGMERNKTDDPR